MAPLLLDFLLPPSRPEQSDIARPFRDSESCLQFGQNFLGKSTYGNVFMMICSFSEDSYDLATGNYTHAEVVADGIIFANNTLMLKFNDSVSDFITRIQ